MSCDCFNIISIMEQSSFGFTMIEKMGVILIEFTDEMYYKSIAFC